MKNKEWLDSAATALEEMAKHNQYIVSDMLIAVLEERGYEQNNYSALGTVFTQAARKGIIKKQPTNQKSNRVKTVWLSLIYKKEVE